MAKIVGIDAMVQISTNGTTWTTLTERNEFTLNVRVETAEARVFVASLAEAFSNKARTWMSWSGSINGYLDDADNTIFDTVKAGAEVWLKFYDSRATTAKSWTGKGVLTTFEHSTGTEDYATLNVEFEGNGILTRNTS